MDHPDLLVLVRISIFALMLDIGLTIPFGELTSLWRRPALLIRSLLAVLVLVPGVVLLLLWLLDLPRAVATGLAVLAAAPGAPLTTMRSQMAGGSTPYSASLQLTLALLAVLTTPLTLAIFHAMFVLETAGLPSVEVAREVAIVQFLPVSIGLLVRRLVPGLAGVADRPLTVLANVLFALLIAVTLVPSVRMILHLGTLPALAVVIMVGISLALGHLLGGGGSPRACRARHREHRAQRRSGALHHGLEPRGAGGASDAPVVHDCGGDRRHSLLALEQASCRPAAR
jgi:bile acid:Na+ symporter, BASS family